MFDLPISEAEIEELEEDYSVNLEAQYYSNIETDGVTACHPPLSTVNAV